MSIKERWKYVHAGDTITDELWWDIRELFDKLEECEKENERLNITIARERMEIVQLRERLGQ
jgi:Fe-S cluster assembly scaffold protein SufB